MPTIIDELVVSLKLDSSEFSQGQRKAVDSLRGIEAQAQQTTASVGSQTNRLRGAIAAINNPLAALKEGFMQAASRQRTAHDTHVNNLNTLSAESRRAGQSVRAGAEVGAEGFSKLGVAALGVYAAIKTVQTAIGVTERTAGQTANFGRSAYYLGVTPRWLGGVTGYGRTKGTSEETTLNALNDFVQKQTEYRETGGDAYKDIMVGLERVGVDPLQKIENILPQLARALSEKDPRAAQYWANQAGLGPLINMLSFGEQPYNAGVQQYDTLAPTAEEIQISGEFEAARADIAVHFNKLQRHMVVEFGPALIVVMDALSGIADLLSKNGGMVVDYILGMFIPGGPVAAHVMREIFAGATVPGYPSSVPGGALSAAPADDRRWWEKLLPPGLGGRVTPSSSGSAPITTGHQTLDDPRGMIPVLRQAAIDEGLDPDSVVALAGAEGLHEKKYATWDVNGMSYGALQGHQGGMADEFQKATGLNPADPQNETALNRWLIHYGATHGWSKWSAVTTGRVAAPRRIGNPLQPSAPASASHLPSLSSQYIFGTPKPPPGAGLPGFTWPEQQSARDLARVRAELAAMHARRIAENERPVERHITVGDVHIEVPAGADAARIAQAVTSVVHRGAYAEPTSEGRIAGPLNTQFNNAKDGHVFKARGQVAPSAPAEHPN